MIASPSGNSGAAVRQRCTTKALSPSHSNSTSPAAPAAGSAGTAPSMRHRPIRGSRRATAGFGVGPVMVISLSVAWVRSLPKTALRVPAHRPVFDDHRPREDLLAGGRGAGLE